MDIHQKRAVLDIIEMEGFDYAFVHYSNFSDVEDEEFHELRLDFLEARTKLANLVGYEVD